MCHSIILTTMENLVSKEKIKKKLQKIHKKKNPGLDSDNLIRSTPNKPNVHLKVS